jgi:hypothetical protein
VLTLGGPGRPKDSLECLRSLIPLRKTHDMTSKFHTTANDKLTGPTRRAEGLPGGIALNARLGGDGTIPFLAWIPVPLEQAYLMIAAPA